MRRMERPGGAKDNRLLAGYSRPGAGQGGAQDRAARHKRAEEYKREQQRQELLSQQSRVRAGPKDLQSDK